MLAVVGTVYVATEDLDQSDAATYTYNWYVGTVYQENVVLVTTSNAYIASWIGINNNYTGDLSIRQYDSGSLTNGFTLYSMSGAAPTTSDIGTYTLTLQYKVYHTDTKTYDDYVSITISITINAAPVIDTPTTLYLYYNANGGSGAPATQSITSTSTAKTFTLSLTVPTRDGYNWGGWNISSSGAYTQYSPGGSISISSNTTLYAVWHLDSSTVTTVEYTFTSNISHCTCTVSSNLSVPTNNGLFGVHIVADEGYSEPTTISVTFGGTAVTTASYSYGNYTYYALFSIQPGYCTGNVIISGSALEAEDYYTYTLLYSANGGSGTIPDPQTARVANQSYTFTVDTAATMAKIGYKFLGWGFTSESTTVMDTVTLMNTSSTKMIYAVYEAIKVTFDSQGGSDVDPIVAETGTITEPDEPTREGYTFAGWFIDAGCTDGNQFDFATIITEPMTLYALWYRATAPVASFTYVVDGLLVIFTDTSVAPDSWQWSFADTKTSMSQSPAHTYSAIGSYTVTLTISNSYNGGTTNSYAAAVSITDATIKYAVVFDSDGGTSINTITVVSGSSIVKPVDPTYIGHIFCGWYDLSVTGEETFDFSTPITANTTLTAGWVEGETPAPVTDNVLLYAVIVFVLIGVACLFGTVLHPILGIVGIFDLIACALIYFLVI